MKHPREPSGSRGVVIDGLAAETDAARRASVGTMPLTHAEMPVSQNSDRNKVETPEQQRNVSAVTAFSFCHGGKHTGHGHKEATGKEDPVDDQQAPEPTICFVFRLHGQTDEESGKRHHTIPQQVIVEDQAAPLEIENPGRLVVQHLCPDCGGLGKVNQQDQHRIDSGKHHTGVGGHLPVTAAFMMQSRRHHDIADGQKHTDKIEPEGETKENEYREKEDGNDNQRCADHGYCSVHKCLLQARQKLP